MKYKEKSSLLKSQLAALKNPNDSLLATDNTTSIQTEQSKTIKKIMFHKETLTKQTKLSSKLINTEENLVSIPKIEKTRMISKSFNTDEIQENNKINNKPSIDKKKFDEKFVFTENEMTNKSINTDPKEESNKSTQCEEEVKTPHKPKSPKIKLTTVSQQTDSIKLISRMISTLENADFFEKCNVCEKRKGIKVYNDYQQTEKPLATDKKINTEMIVGRMKIEKFFIFQKRSRTMKEPEKCEECEERRKVKTGFAYQQTDEIKKINKLINTKLTTLCLRITTFRIFNNFASLPIKSLHEQFCNTPEVIFKDCMINSDEIKMIANEKNFIDKKMNTEPVEFDEKSFSNEKWINVSSNIPSMNTKKDIYTSIEFKNDMLTSTKELNEKKDAYASTIELKRKKDAPTSSSDFNRVKDAKINKNHIYTSMTEFKHNENSENDYYSIPDQKNRTEDFNSKLIATNNDYTSTSEFNKINEVCTSTSDLQIKKEKCASSLNKKEICTSNTDLNQQQKSKNEIYISIENFRKKIDSINKNDICYSATKLNKDQANNEINKKEKKSFASISELHKKLNEIKSVCTSSPELIEIYHEKNAEISTITEKLTNTINSPTSDKKKNYDLLNKDEAQTSTSDLFFTSELNFKKEINSSVFKLPPNNTDKQHVAMIGKNEVQTSTSDLLFGLNFTQEVEPNISDAKKFENNKNEVHTSTSDLVFAYELNDKKKIGTSTTELQKSILDHKNIALIKKNEAQTSTSDLFFDIELKNKKTICTSTTEIQPNQNKLILTNVAICKKKGSVDDGIKDNLRHKKKFSSFNNVARIGSFTASPFKRLCEEWIKKDCDLAKKKILTKNVINNLFFE